MGIRWKRNLREQLEAAGWTPARVNAAVGWNRSAKTIYNLLDPTRQEVELNLETLDEACNLFGLSPNDLLEREPWPEPPIELGPDDELCDMHAARGWSHLTWIAGAHCPLCREEKGLAPGIVQPEVTAEASGT
jgi:hypothetical protein